jgi:hypothetical protein
MYNIYVRDDWFRKVGEVTDFVKLDIIPRFNATGSFVLDMPTDCAATKQLIKPKYGIIVKKDGITVFSGTVTSRQRSFSGDNDTMTFSGKDDNYFLESAIAFPETGGHFTLQDYDVRTGAAETIMKQYVDYNIGQNAQDFRKLLTIEADQGLGASITGRARFDNLLEFEASLALKGGGLGFRVAQVDNALQFHVYQPSDKTTTAFFSPLLGNLSAFEYTNENPTCNYVIVGGGGEGKARTINWDADNASIAKYGRVETFLDRRDTTDTAELTQSMDEELTNKAEQNTFNFTPIDTPQLAFGRDYGLGDKVTIILTQPNEVIDVETLYYFISAYQTVPVQSEKVRKIQEKLDVIQDVVREVKISITPSGETISPVVGTSDSNNGSIKGIFDKMKKITRRVSNLERR